jgi:eukaryotic-like serine/threonine-protein kinase
LGRLEQFCELTVEPGTPNPKSLQFTQEADPTPVSDRRVCPNCGLKLSTEIAVCPNDGTVLINNADLDGKLSNQYEFLAEIGSGGMGVIYKARHIALNQTVAIKMLHTNRLDELSVRRFQQEAKAVTALDHPSIVRVRDFGITESGQPHMVLDYIEGDTLAKAIEKKAGLSVPEALEIFIQACDALEHAHMRGVLHRDLKPSNIMLVPRSSGPPLVKIVDFGIAKIANTAHENAAMNLTQTGEVFGSPLYMSPEQASGTKLDRRSDIYSFGCVMYETLTGAPPFVGGSSIETIFQQLNDQAPPLREGSLGKEFPEDVEAIVARALEKKPDARYQSMAELKNALLNSKLGKKQDAVSLLPDDKSGVTKKRYAIKALLFALVTLIILASVSGYFVFSTMNQPQPKPVVEVDDATKAKQIIASSDNSNEVNLHGLKVTDKMLEYFAECTKPSSVNLDGSDVQGPGLANLIHLPLISLSMASSKLTDRGFEEIKHMENLEKLDLRKTAITSMGLTQLTALKKLRELNMDETFITDEALKTIASIRSLKSISANQCHFTAKAIDELKAARPDLKVNAGNTEQIPSTSKESTGT